MVVARSFSWPSLDQCLLGGKDFVGFTSATLASGISLYLVTISNSILAYALVLICCMKFSTFLPSIFL